ncbi:endo-1,3-beta glucanase [Savitreella phatthalungensis]
MLGNGSQQSWPMPYVVSWAGDGFWVHHPDKADLMFGPDAHTDLPKYFYASVNVHSLKLGLDSTVELCNLQRIAKLKVEIHARTASRTIVYPLSVGAARITATNKNKSPPIKLEIFFRALEGPLACAPPHRLGFFDATLQSAVQHNFQLISQLVIKKKMAVRDTAVPRESLT